MKVADEPSILVLGQGHPDDRDTWSGIPALLCAALRAKGAHVATADVEMNPAGQVASKLLTCHPNRRRWGARHHYGPIGFRLRSARARRALARHADVDAVLQFGGQFCPFSRPDARLFVYCDANACFGAESPFPKRSSALSPAQFAAMVERERAVYTRAAKVFTFSDALRQSFLGSFDLSPDRVATVYAGANLPQPPSEDQLDGRKSPVPTILFIGKEFERKGGRDLLAAFDRVRQAIPGARLIIAGCSPQVNGAPGVETLGFIDRSESGRRRLSELFCSADLFCMPSQYEAFGVVFIEAMLHGLPCVGTDICAIPEIIDHGRTGWLVPPTAPNALADVLVRALCSREQLREMGRLGRAKALRTFTWDVVAGKMLAAMAGAAPHHFSAAQTSLDESLLCPSGKGGS